MKKLKNTESAQLWVWRMGPRLETRKKPKSFHDILSGASSSVMAR